MKRGFTLLEISLVLAILIIMSAIAVPIFQGTLTRERLRKAAESIGADWTRTRATAIQTGETQLWACQLATSNFANGVADPTITAGAPGQGTDGAATQGPITAEQLLATNLSGRLPEGIVISSATTSELDTVVEMGQATQTSESGMATMFFYPDGTSTTARLTVKVEEKENLTMSVMINGLAGTVRVVHGSTSAGAAQ